LEKAVVPVFYVTADKYSNSCCNIMAGGFLKEGEQ
jgi:hypothetical protein